MKYTITIDQVGIVKAGLAEKTDLIDWAIIDYLKDWYILNYRNKARVITVKNPESGESTTFVFVKVSCEDIKRDLILLKLDNNEILRRIDELRKLGLLRVHLTNPDSLFFVLTSKCFETTTTNKM